MPALCLTVSAQGERPSPGPTVALATNTPAASYQTPGIWSGGKVGGGGGGMGKFVHLYMYMYVDNKKQAKIALLFQQPS